MPALQTLRRSWGQQFYRTQERSRWRTAAEGLPPAARMLSSPSDLDAHYATKYTPSWVGYKVHFTESGEADAPHLITPGETTSGPIADAEVTNTIQEQLHAQQRLPRRHLVDPGYRDAELRVTSQPDYGVEWLGPPRPDDRGQAQAGRGFDASHFVIDWDQPHAIGPLGQRSHSWTPAIDGRHNAVIKMKFSQRDGQACASRPDCPRATRRTVTVRPQAQHLRLQATRQRERTTAYTAEDAKRAGMEGTISQAVRAFGVRRARYLGLAQTHLQHSLTAAAITFVRVGMWIAGERPAKTRPSRLQALMRQAAAAG